MPAGKWTLLIQNRSDRKPRVFAEDQEPVDIEDRRVVDGVEYAAFDVDRNNHCAYYEVAPRAR